MFSGGRLMDSLCGDTEESAEDISGKSVCLYSFTWKNYVEEKPFISYQNKGLCQRNMEAGN